MKPKLTKAQLAKAKRAVVVELGRVQRSNFVGALMSNAGVWRQDSVWPEVERLLRVALRAVRGA